MDKEGTGTSDLPSQGRSGQPSRVILVVEATAAAGVSSSTTRKWLDLLLKKIDGDSKVSETATSTAAQGDTPQSFEDLPKIQYALIAYGSWDGSTQAPIQFSSWCANLTELFDWLDGVQYVGGASNKGLALTEALAQAIIMSKYPYPDGSRPTPAGKSHYQPTLGKECGLHAHTHIWLVCSSFTPCRLPIPWCFESDTKAALFTNFYPAFLEAFEAMKQQLKHSSGGSVFGNLDAIQHGLQPPITPGTADIWDIIFSLSRHNMSLSILSGMQKLSSRSSSGQEQYRGCVESFIYANSPLSVLQIKQAYKIGIMGWQVAQAVLLMSPLHTEAFKIATTYISKLMSARTQRTQQQQQQQQQQQEQQQQQQVSQAQQSQTAVATPPQGYAAAAAAKPAAVQVQQQTVQQPQPQQPQQQQAMQQQQQQQQPAQLTQQQLAMLQQRQQQQQQQQQQLQQQQAAQQAQQAQQQQQQLQLQLQRQQQAQAQAQQQPQQQWMQAAQAAAVRPVVQQAMQQQQQQPAQPQMGVSAVAGSGQQVPAGLSVQQQAMLLQQQKQQQQAVLQQQMVLQQQQQQAQQAQAQAQQAGRFGMGMQGLGTGAVAGGVMFNQQGQQQQAQLGVGGGLRVGVGVSQAQVYMPQAQPQQMLLQQQQQQQMAGFMPQQAMNALQPQMFVQVNLPQQQQMQAQAQAQQQGAAAASGAGREKARQPFWRGTLYMSLPGEQPQKLAEVELLANNASSMSSIFANHGDHIIADKILTVQDVRLHTQNQSLRLSRGSFKVLNQLAAFPRLQGQVSSRADKQVMLEGKIGGLITIFTFGQQSTKPQQPAATALSLLEGSAIYCVPK